MSEALKERLNNIEKRLEKLTCLVTKKQEKLSDKEFIDNQELLKLMNISKRTAQQWRDNKIIGFFQVGNKIYYRLSDIQKLLEENYNPKKEILK
jgi:hypothetical protein